MNMSESELERERYLTANQAVKKTFAIMGVNIDNPKDVEDFRKDIRFAGELRSNANKGLGALIISIIGIIVAGIATAVIHYIKG